jgi:hypothetical protein
MVVSLIVTLIGLDVGHIFGRYGGLYVGNILGPLRWGRGARNQTLGIWSSGHFDHLSAILRVFHRLPTRIDIAPKSN